jgi:hypothetical protein
VSVKEGEATEDCGGNYWLAVPYPPAPKTPEGCRQLQKCQARSEVTDQRDLHVSSWHKPIPRSINSPNTLFLFTCFGISNCHFLHPSYGFQYASLQSSYCRISNLLSQPDTDIVCWEMCPGTSPQNLLLSKLNLLSLFSMFNSRKSTFLHHKYQNRLYGMVKIFFSTTKKRKKYLNRRMLQHWPSSSPTFHAFVLLQKYCNVDGQSVAN